MIKHNFIGLLAVALIVGFLAGCASQRQANVDPIFKATPSSKFSCAYAGNNRNSALKATESTPGQATIGGILGGIIGNQFGAGSGRDIATGVGAAAGAAAGAYNAHRMNNNRYQRCVRRKEHGNPSS